MSLFCGFGKNYKIKTEAAEYFCNMLYLTNQLFASCPVGLVKITSKNRNRSSRIFYANIEVLLLTQPK